MTGRIVQISISRGGIPKLPVAEATVTPEGILGDSWAHPQYHGGPNQALLLIGAESIEELVAKGYALYPGALGENLTTSGLDRRQLRAGQRYRIGDVLIELTKIRVPCSTIEVYGRGIKADLYESQVKAGDASSPRWALGGFYAAVRRTGVIRQQDIITLVDQVV
jgi:MOSC domain-containing protein YiiM